MAEPMLRRNRTFRFLAVGLATEGAVALLGLLLGLLCRPSPFGLCVPNLRLVMVGAVATAPLLALFVLFWRAQARPFARIRSLLIHHFLPLVHTAGPGDLLIVSAVAGLGEELLFRGVLQVQLQHVVPLWLAILVAALIFGAAHWVTTTYMIVATAIGCYFGFLAAATGSLVPVMIAHGLYDFLALLYVRRVSPPPPPGV